MKHSDRLWLQPTAGTELPPTVWKKKSVFALRVKTVISSGLEETHRPVHASSNRISNKLRILNSCPSLRNTDYVCDCFLFPRHCFARSNPFTAMFLDSHVAFRFSPLLCQCCCCHSGFMFTEESSIFKWLWWIDLWVYSSASFSYKVTYNACSCQI